MGVISYVSVLLTQRPVGPLGLDGETATQTRVSRDDRVLTQCVRAERLQRETTRAAQSAAAGPGQLHVGHLHYAVAYRGQRAVRGRRGRRSSPSKTCLSS